MKILFITNTNEIIGIVAGIFVLTSFLFRKELFIRLINIVGASLFVAYGALIGSISVLVLNAILVTVHIAYILLSYLKKKKEKECMISNILSDLKKLEITNDNEKIIKENILKLEEEINKIKK